MKTTHPHAIEAYKLGVAAAEAAASWAADGNSDPAAIRQTLAMLEQGDPEAYDRLPAYPDLSGEWADAPTPHSLARDITGEPDTSERVIGLLMDEWERGVSETFEDACVAELTRWVA